MSTREQSRPTEASRAAPRAYHGVTAAVVAVALPLQLALVVNGDAVLVDDARHGGGPLRGAAPVC